MLDCVCMSAWISWAFDLDYYFRVNYSWASATGTWSFFLKYYFYWTFWNLLFHVLEYLFANRPYTNDQITLQRQGQTNKILHMFLFLYFTSSWYNLHQASYRSNSPGFVLYFKRWSQQIVKNARQLILGLYCWIFRCDSFCNIQLDLRLPQIIEAWY